MRKAKLLETSEIVNVHDIDYAGQGMDSALIEKDGLMKNVSLYDLQFIDSTDEEKVNILTSEIDWEQRRYEIAKAILTGYSSGEGFYSGVTRPAEHCACAIEYADELINQLKTMQ